MQSKISLWSNRLTFFYLEFCDEAADTGFGEFFGSTWTVFGIIRAIFLRLFLLWLEWFGVHCPKESSTFLKGLRMGWDWDAKVLKRKMENWSFHIISTTGRASDPSLLITTRRSKDMRLSIFLAPKSNDD